MNDGAAAQDRNNAGSRILNAPLIQHFSIAGPSKRPSLESRSPLSLLPYRMNGT